MLYEDETFVLRRCFFDVHNQVDLGRHEEAYHRGVVRWLRAHGIPFKSKAPHPLLLGDDLAHTLYPDLVVWDAITVDLKVRPWGLERSDHIQLFDYLKSRGDRLGLLVNMGTNRVEIERLAYTASEPQLSEQWDAWRNRIGGRARTLGGGVYAALGEIVAAHTTGYSDEVTRKLVQCALMRQGLNFVLNPEGKAYFEGECIHEGPLGCLVVENEILLVVTALFDSSEFAVRLCQSYLKALDLDWGVAANFGKKAIQITGISSGA